MKRLPKIRSVSGMTLIELLVAIAISGLVLAGVVQVLTTSTSSYSLQEDMAAMQQNLRMSKMFLERDSRMAGCGMQNFFDRGTRVYPVEFTNAGGESSTDILVINYVDLDNGSCGNVLPQLTLNGSMPAASAEATVNENLTDNTTPPTPPYSAWNSAFTCAGTPYGGTPFTEFMAIITSPDGSQSDVVYITTIQANSNKIQNRPYASFENKIINSYPPGSTINFFSNTTLTQITYRYSNGTLLRNGQAIADNLEDLQFAFGLDTDTDDIVDSWIIDRDLTNAEKDQIRLMRINVLGRTSREHSGQSNTREAIEDHVAGTGQDKYRRQLIQLTVKPRNLRS
ncbi:MAG: PilW family protein [Desulfatirhabdiaceae bacterium]